MSDKINITEIEAAAKKATSGPWRSTRIMNQKSSPTESDTSRLSGSVKSTKMGRHIYCDSTARDVDAIHIANCDPGTILRLCAVARAAMEVASSATYSARSASDAQRRGWAKLDSALEGIEVGDD